jgi:hypothetical protein
VSDRDWIRVGKYLGAVVLIANFCRFVAWGAVISYSAYARREDLDAKDIANTAYHAGGAFGIIGAFLFLIVQG